MGDQCSAVAATQAAVFVPPSRDPRFGYPTEADCCCERGAGVVVVVVGGLLPTG